MGFDNMMTNTKMSIFNKYIEPFTKEITYKKYVVKNVFWDDVVGVNTNTGYENNDKVNVFIPFDKNEKDLQKYVEPKNYNGKGWTIQNGDFIINGDITETEVEGIKDLKAYEVFVIADWSKKDFGSYNMQHFEIRGQ